jgi:hypothetical protein
VAAGAAAAEVVYGAAPVVAGVLAEAEHRACGVGLAANPFRQVGYPSLDLRAVTQIRNDRALRYAQVEQIGVHG